MSLRVREVLVAANPAERAALKALLPSAAVRGMPDVPTLPYPAALLAALGPKSLSYSNLGLLAESMLKLPTADDITMDNLIMLANYYIRLSPRSVTKIRGCESTAAFLDALITTRCLIDSVCRGKLHGEKAIGYDAIVGHPDAHSEGQLYEIKLTGQLRTNWTNFLLQLFAYAALDMSAADIYLVLPLQGHIWYYDAEAWSERAAYRELLNGLAKKYRR